MTDGIPVGLMSRPGMDTLERSATRPLQKPGSGPGTDASRLQDAAKEFEALFLGQLLTVMRASVEESGMADKGLGQDVYTQMFDQELARTLAGRGALGISDLLIRKFSGPAPATGAGSGAHDAPKTQPHAGVGGAGDPGEEVPDFRMPVLAPVSSAFGIRMDPFTHELRPHSGLDIAAPEGSEVHVACAGRVVFSGYEKGYGNTIVVQHADGFETRYAHLGTLRVNAGDWLESRQVLGTVGSTGRSTGPHLHFEVSRYGDKIDPQGLLSD